MNTETPPSSPSAAESTAAPTPTKPRRNRQLPALRLPTALAIAALALVVWQRVDIHQQMSELRQSLAQRLGEDDNAVRESRMLTRQNHEELQALAGKVGLLEAKLAETQGQRDALESMYQELSRGRDEAILADVEQSVALASQQLQLAGNVEAALIALQAAESRLARLGNSQFLPVRKLLARDIGRLKTLPLADVSGMAARLEGIAASVDGLPLAYVQRPPKAAAPTETKTSRADVGMSDPEYWRLLGADLINELKQLVRVEYMDQPAPALLAPTQTFFLRENLRLRLINARLSLLQRDGRSFRDDMQQAQRWLELYFDMRNPGVKSARDTLKQLAAIDLNPQLPSLDETLTSLRSIKLPRDKK